MAFYSKTLTAPPNTPASSPVSTELEIFPGIVSHVWLQFPRGCAGLLQARILRAAVQIWPSNPDAHISSDGFIVDWNEEYNMTDQPLFITLEAYNLDDTFPHTVTLWLEVKDAAMYQAAQVQSSMLTKFLQLVGIK